MKIFFTTLFLMLLTSSVFAVTGPSVTLQTTTLNNPFPLTFQVNVTFSEPVAGFFPADVIVANGTVVSMTGNTGQANYVLTIQPTNADCVTVFIPANSAVSVTTGEPNQVSSPLTIPPAATVEPSVILQTATLSNPFPLPFQVSVTFSEAVVGLIQSGINVTNGSVTSIQGSSGQSNYIITIQPAAPGAITVVIPAGSVVSVSTGAPNQASSPLIIPPAAAVDPSVILQTATLSNPFPLSFQVSATFSEAVVGLVPSGINVTNGSVTSIQGSSGQSNYIITIQPAAPGAITVVIPAGSVVSVSTGAPNQASSPLTIPPAAAVDPSVILQTATLSNPFPLPFQVSVTFSEAVVGLIQSGINVTNGSVTSIQGSSGQSNYIITIQPAAPGNVTVVIPAGSVVSVSTGAPNQASNLLTIPGLNPTLPPASNFNLKTWSLTLPLPLGSLNNAISIGQATLNGTPGVNNGYINPPYFLTDPVSGAMNMFAPLNGGTTPGSEFARTEFYEILPGSSPYWKLSTFASNSLAASLLVSQVGPIQKRVIVGQIHDKGNTDLQGHTASNSPFVKLYYDRDALDPNNSVCNGCVYAQIRKTPAQSSYLKIVNLAKNIPLNTIFKYNITLLRDGTLTITVNNVSTVIKLSTSTDNTIGWGTQQLYFKAGVYNLEFGSSNLVGGAASFYSLQVTHT